MRIEIIRESKDGLSRTRWVFDFYAESWGELGLRLDEYLEEKRESKKKRTWEKTKVYLRIGDMRSWQGTSREIKVWDVPIWPDVEREAKDRVVKMVWALPMEHYRK